MKWLFDLLGNVAKFTINERANDYRSTYLRNQDLLTQVTLETDRALMTFSIAALATLAALNERLFSEYGWLSYFTLLLFVVVIMSVIVGYYLSRQMLIDAQNIISANYKKSLTTPLGKGLSKVQYARSTKVINYVSIVCFIAGMLCLLTLLAVYIEGAGK